MGGFMLFDEIRNCHGDCSPLLCIEEDKRDAKFLKLILHQAQVVIDELQSRRTYPMEDECIVTVHIDGNQRRLCFLRFLRCGTERATVFDAQVFTTEPIDYKTGYPEFLSNSSAILGCGHKEVARRSALRV
jgi:hypothetical protein